MQTEPTNNAPPPRGKRSGLGPLFATALMFAVVALLWRELEQMKQSGRELLAQNEQLRRELAQTRKVANAAEAAENARIAADMQRSKAAREAAGPAKIEPAPEARETLLLQQPTVEKTGNGLVVRFGFKPVGDDLPAQLTLVVRVPAGGERILSLKPIEKTGYSDVECIVDPNGSLGMVDGTPADLQALTFELAVSGPVKALVRGSKGIKAFEIDIAPGGCNVRRL